LQYINGVYAAGLAGNLGWSRAVVGYANGQGAPLQGVPASYAVIPCAGAIIAQTVQGNGLRRGAVINNHIGRTRASGVKAARGYRMLIDGKPDCLEFGQISLGDILTFLGDGNDTPRALHVPAILCVMGNR
jgi:hypothetical protein